MYILYGGRFTRTVAVQMVLEEGGIPYELRELDIVAGEHREAEFLAINPAGFVPAIITPEGQVLHEAAAIMLYLADRHGLGDLAPRVDAPARGLFYSKLFFLTNDVQPAMKRIFFPQRYSTDPADTPRIKAQALRTAEERWKVVDAHLAAHGPYHLGERFSLVDLYMVMWAAVFDPKEVLFEACPAVARCYGLVAARPKIAPLMVQHETVATDYRAATSERS
jgi:glutathione S-transferase